MCPRQIRWMIVIVHMHKPKNVRKPERVVGCLRVDSNFLTRDSHSTPSAERTLPRLPRSYLPPPFSPLFFYFYFYYYYYSYSAS